MKNLLRDNPSKQVTQRYRAGSVHTGYTVKQIRECLERLDDDMLVVGKWDDMYTPVQAIFLLSVNNDAYEEQVVIIDVDHH